MFRPYQDPHLFVFSSLRTCPSQPSVFWSAFYTKHNVNTSSYLFSPASSMPYLSQHKHVIVSSVITADNLGTTLMASFRFTENPVLRLLLLQSAFPQVHPSSPSLKNLCSISPILDLPASYVRTFFFKSCPFWHHWVFVSPASGSWVVSAVQNGLALSPAHCRMPSITPVSFSASFTPHWIISSDYINLSNKRLTWRFHNLLQPILVLLNLSLSGLRDKPPVQPATCNVYCPDINPS